MDSEAEWRLLPLKEQISKACHLTGVSFRRSILVFGGEDPASYRMYFFSEEGEMVEDLSSDPLILGGMCQGSVVIERGQVLAAGWRKV